MGEVAAAQQSDCKFTGPGAEERIHESIQSISDNPSEDVYEAERRCGDIVKCCDRQMMKCNGNINVILASGQSTTNMVNLCATYREEAIRMESGKRIAERAKSGYFDLRTRILPSSKSTLLEVLDIEHQVATSIRHYEGKKRMPNDPMLDASGWYQPRHIYSDTDFDASQDAIWARFRAHKDCLSRRQFPTPADFEYGLPDIQYAIDGGANFFQSQNTEWGIKTIMDVFRTTPLSCPEHFRDSDMDFDMQDADRRHFSDHRDIILLHRRLGKGYTIPFMTVHYTNSPDITPCLSTITPLVSMMVEQNIRYGYITNVDRYIFLRIDSERPGVVYCTLRDPVLDVDITAENALYRTAVGEVFAFMLHAELDSTTPSQAWLREAHALTKSSSSSALPSPSHESEITSVHCEDMKPCHDIQCDDKADQVSDHTGNHEVEQSVPDPSSPAALEKCSMASKSGSVSGLTDGTFATVEVEQPSTLKRRSGTTSATEIKYTRAELDRRPYCTHACLRSLVSTSRPDRLCPNAQLHPSIDDEGERLCPVAAVREEMRIRVDEAIRGLGCSGSRGTLLRITLHDSGYTFVAKGVEKEWADDDVEALSIYSEEYFYGLLKTIQGEHIPVCLGILELDKVYHWQTRQLSHFLLLSWAGYTLEDGVSVGLRPRCYNKAITAFKAIHRLGVTQNSAYRRNMVFDPATERLMVIDFERGIKVSRHSSSAQKEMRYVRERLD